MEVEEETAQIMKIVPTVDLSLLYHHNHHHSVINQIHQAFRNFGFFHVINHGIHDSAMEEALNVNSIFFGLPIAVKEEVASDDVKKPARSSRMQLVNGMLSREFLKLYAYPLHHFIHFMAFKSSKL